jgi:cytochrome c5
MSEQHESPIKTPKQLIVVIVLAFVIPIAIAALVSQLVTGGRKASADANPDKLSELIRPVARLQVASASAAAVQGPRTGEQIFNTVCGACHTAGVAGAPKIGDSAAWAPRIALGLDGLVKSATAGKGAMPPKGGGADLSEADLIRAIAYIANKSGANFAEPAAATTASAPAVAVASADRSGEEIVKAQCYKCHETGESGAPRMGDKKAWGPRVARGLDALTKSAIKGHGSMPARGGMADLTDAEMTKAMLFMFNYVSGESATAGGA